MENKNRQSYALEYKYNLNGGVSDDFYGTAASCSRGRIIKSLQQEIPQSVSDYFHWTKFLNIHNSTMKNENNYY